MREKPLILVADDQANFREIISTKLKSAGFDCVAVHNGPEAVQKAGELVPDFILMDINMPPGQNGVQSAIAIKENEKTKDINIVFLTEEANPWPGIVGGDNQMVSQELGMQGFFAKENLDALVEDLQIAFGKTPPPASEEK